MLKSCIRLGVLLLILVAVVYAQAPTRTFTDVLTPQATAGAALTLYKSQVEGYLISDGNDITALKAQIVDLQTRVSALENKPSGTTAVYTLAYSTALSHSNGLPLDGATVKGGLQIYTALAATPGNFNPPNVSMVVYTLDGVQWANVEHGTPYDFNGGDVLWNTATLANGKHVITQAVSTTAGTTETDSASFTVAN